MRENKRTVLFIVVIFFIIFLVTLLRNAWVSQRAYLTFRVVENWVHGYGLGFNVGERVLPVSQPLWPLFLGTVYWFMGSLLSMPDLNLLYYLSISLSIFFSLLTFGLLLKSSVGSLARISIIAIGLLLSKGFIDFSTSGLENPLVHFLILLFFLGYVRLEEWPIKRHVQSLVLMGIIGSLILALQWEWFLLIGAVLLSIGIRYRSKRRVWAYLGLGLVPLGLYLLATCLAYGSPLPNMYVARFHAGLGWSRLARQGIMYLLNLIDFDPVSIIMISLGILAIMVFKARYYYPFVLGIIGSMAFIILIGGDSLGGRLFSPLVFTSALLLTRSSLTLTHLGQVALAMIVAIGLVSERSPLRSDVTYQFIEPDHRGIIDGRGKDYQDSGLLGLNRDSLYPPGSEWAGDDWAFRSYTDFVIFRDDSAGFSAYAQGPESYVIFATGLVDPLLARLPTVDMVDWDLFSLYRQVPDYFETAILDSPQVWDCRELADYYSDLKMIVSDPIFSKARIKAIWRTETERPSVSMLESCH